ncbi:MAG: NAD-dependent epimerase, partial [Candidatus Hydrogenedentes bacterium]|nr:NAD-dependent epimerase [Candidatus Hydrogenedentota bacterium]
KQVRDNIHSSDLVEAFHQYYETPRSAAVYNIGGSRHANCSMLEAIAMCEQLTGNKMNYEYSDANRSGDHMWWVSDVRQFQKDYPDWKYAHDIDSILQEVYRGLEGRT